MDTHDQDQMDNIVLEEEIDENYEPNVEGLYLQNLFFNFLLE